MKKTRGKLFLKQHGIKILAVCFWLFVWEVTSRIINEEIFITGPFAVLGTLLGMSKSIEFWQTIFFSFARIVMGFLLALVTGTLLAVASYRSRLLKELIAPLMKVIKAMPVASFIILLLIWINKRNLSVLISFLMVVPMIYANVGQGLKATDYKLLEMAKVFGISRIKTIRAIYIPSIIPYFISAVSVGLGFCWKAGIAAEVIGRPPGSIGVRLYEAKLYFMTKELFAWTVVIIIISIIFEMVVLRLIQMLYHNPFEQNHRL